MGGDEPAEILDHALAHQHQCTDDGDGQEDPGGRSGQVDPEVADGGGAAPYETPDEGDGDGDADGGRHEVLDRQAHHLGQVGHRDLAGGLVSVVLGCCCVLV